ncbi:putative necrosis-inducing factor-domain-containing protein [Cladorrhinum samala]|uniref:Necrosis-inducing factor-domain-containing protein n=1 Tax=Cladorrhinum samala TaxID=585594 RepID=A0AAV9HA60_9PEZI|nr:putative necrosis-inducing factor-domain-containing protein [Cladorrhinum samala]
MRFSKQAILVVVGFCAAVGRATSNCRDFRDWESTVSKASPTVKDCEELWTQLGWDDRLYWTIGDTQYKLAYYGTCYLGGQRAGHGTSRLGNEDLRHVIRKSIDDYKYLFDDGIERVGTKGNMTCGDDEVWDRISWGIYHSPK